MNIAIPTSVGVDFSARMAAHFRSSLSYLSEVVGREGQLKDTAVPSWQSYGYYNACIRALEKGDIDGARISLAKSMARMRDAKRSPSARYLAANETGLEDMSLIRGELALMTDRAIGVGYASPSVTSNGNELKKLVDALDLLRRYAHHFYREYADLADEILLAGDEDGVHIRSGSSFNLFGLIVFWADVDHTPIYYLEKVVHEVAHLRLFVVNIEDQLVLNPPEERFKAPFRDDARPMLGIFHAFFVLARMVIALQTVKNNIEDERHAADLNGKLQRAVDRLFSTADEVRRYGVLTEIGQAIFDDCIKAVERRSSLADGLATRELASS